MGAGVGLGVGEDAEEQRNEDAVLYFIIFIFSGNGAEVTRGEILLW